MSLLGYLLNYSYFPPTPKPHSTSQGNLNVLQGAFFKLLCTGLSSLLISPYELHKQARPLASRPAISVRLVLCQLILLYCQMATQLPTTAHNSLYTDQA